MAGSTPAEGPEGPRIGVLALQGAFREHLRMLELVGARAVAVQLPHELEGVHGLVIPGGESTTMGLLMERYSLRDALRSYANEYPVLGTCAGLIMMATRSIDTTQPLLQVLDVSVRRNAFGRQRRSFEAPVELQLRDDRSEKFHGIFIRAPWIEEVGPAVKIIARCDGHIVGVRQGHLIGLAFHPELGSDTRLHAYFLELVRASHLVRSSRS